MTGFPVFTQLSGGGGLCTICIVMQARLKHGNIGNAAFVKKPCIDLKKFIEKAVDHRDVGYHKEATTAAKNLSKVWKVAKMCVQAWRQHVLSVKCLISSLQSVVSQERTGLNIASKI